MKQYIMIIIATLHLINVSVYAVDTFIKQHDTHACIIQTHDHDHEHFHTHNGSSHSHKHNHAQVHTSFSDFFIFSYDTNLFTLIDSSKKFSEVTSWISNPILESLFRPPIV